MEDQKENLQGNPSLSRQPARPRTRVFGKELQNLPDTHRTPKRKASRVPGNLTPVPTEKTVKITESFLPAPQHVEDHKQPILEFLKSSEPRYRVSRDYLAAQTEVTPKMRGILVDWLVDVSLRFKLDAQCLFLAVNLLDRFLAKIQIPRQRLQLLGVTCLMIAAKFEEIYPPQLKDFICVCDGAYTKKEVLAMEGEVLAALDFGIVQPTALFYLRNFNSSLKMDDRLFVFAQYLLEHALVDLNALKHDNCLLAAGAVFLVGKIFRKDGWSEEARAATQCGEEEVKLSAKDLYLILKRADGSSLTALKRKFAEERYFEVSKYQVDRAQPRN